MNKWGFSKCYVWNQGLLLIVRSLTVFVVFSFCVKHTFAEVRREIKENNEVFMGFKDFISVGVIEEHIFVIEFNRAPRVLLPCDITILKLSRGSDIWTNRTDTVGNFDLSGESSIIEIWMQHVPTKRPYPSASPHCAITRKISMDVVSPVRSLNLNRTESNWTSVILMFSILCISAPSVVQ